jgi:Holliday junction resolvase
MTAIETPSRHPRRLPAPETGLFSGLLVREDGKVLLVEVKTVNPSKPFRPHRLREADVDALRRYADLTSGRLLLAHYWSAWNIWTLADPTVFERRDGKLIVDMETAMKASELGLLGDASIATVPPLKLSLLANLTVPQTATRGEHAQQTEIGFTVGAVELSAGGDVLTDEVEQAIAGFMIQFGRWKLTENVVMDHDRLERVDLTLSPEEPIAGQAFDVIGQLSSMYSAMYMVATQSEAGEVSGLRHDVTPGVVGALIPADYFDRPDRTLRLWKFIQQPSIGPESER